MDFILYWNDVALEANKVSHSIENGAQPGPCMSSRSLGIIHLAMYEAFAAIANDPSYPTYFPVLPPPPPGASIEAGITGAAYTTIAALYPHMQPFVYERYLKAGLQGSGISEGVAYGCLIAQIVLQDRGNDPGIDGSAHVPSLAPLAHRPDPDHPNQSFYGPNYGPLSKCFSVTQRWSLLPPPAPNSPEFVRAYKQVKNMGIAPELMGDSGPRRGVDETVVGLFWAYDGAKNIGTPPRLYNQIVRAVAIHKNNTQAQNAKLFALVNVAMADAGILAWDVKYTYNHARPVIGIREYDPSLGPAAVPGHNLNNLADITWLPLGAPRSNQLGKNFTPNFPAYPSGHATFGAAALHITRLFYGVNHLGPDHLLDGISFVSDELNGVTTDNKGTVRPKHIRQFKDGLYQMIIENGMSRIYLGVHWSYDAFALDVNGKPNLSVNIGGTPLGINIANDIFQTGLKPSSVGSKYPLVPKLM
jgi:hypothetical protein